MAFKLPSFFSRNQAQPATASAALAPEADFADTQFRTVNQASGQAERLQPPLNKLVAAAKKSSAGPVVALFEKGTQFKLPLLHRLSFRQQFQLLLLQWCSSLLIGSFFLWLNSHLNQEATTQSQVASDILMHSQRVGKAAPNAVLGQPDAFRQLSESRKELNSALTVLEKGGDYHQREMSAAESALLPLLNGTRKTWTNSDKSAEKILSLKSDLVAFRESLQKLNKLNPVLLGLTEQISMAKAESSASTREVAATSQLVMLMQRMARGSNELLLPADLNPEAAFSLGKDAEAYRSLVQDLLNGSEAQHLAPVQDKVVRSKLIELQGLLPEYQQQVATIVANLPKFVTARQSEQLIATENEALKNSLSALQKRYQEKADTLKWPFWLMVLCAAIATLAAVGIALVLMKDGRTRTADAEQRSREAEANRLQAQQHEEQAIRTNELNQAAILRLMNELQEVADGDLTVQATVSEDITGAIADSINYTVEELRGLVGRVTNTAERVTSASNQAQNISTSLLKSSQAQSREIQDTSHAVLKMAEEITDVSKSANESAEVARQSLLAAEQGSRAVENTIKGMHEIREQIQETSKRIKRLGESSQEIGEITELISDITEQTNVLALNAAIQAASAGEAGRGFSVVAEEVQRLAERSGDAAKQIGALVRTIQTDTHDAVAAMEKSTQGVVEGAKLSDAAGSALSDISRVSNRLAELIQGISFVTEQQATSANSVAHNIQHILGITEQTQAGTQQTAHSIRELSLLAEELKNSVSRFRIAA
jgi:twitching motility protein PilJ